MHDDMKSFGVQDISQDFWGTKDAKRLRKQRLINIDGHAILKQNAYDLNQVGAFFMVCLMNGILRERWRVVRAASWPLRHGPV